MRKNGFEEALFKCEDERFEIDMVFGWLKHLKICSYFRGQIIDSNMSTIRVLEPIAEEIVLLGALEEAEGGAGAGAGSPKFSFQLERRNLSVSHLNSITR